MSFTIPQGTTTAIVGPGISGVATKTSYTLFLLYQLLKTDGGIELLGGSAERAATRALVFNTKGQDLLHLDRPNRLFPQKPDTAVAWDRLGVAKPGPFTSVKLYAPRADTHADAIATRFGTSLLVGVAVVSLFGLTGIERSVLLTLCVAPVGFNTVTFGSLENLDLCLATGTASLSLVASLVLVPAVLVFGSCSGTGSSRAAYRRVVAAGGRIGGTGLRRSNAAAPRRVGVA